MVATENIQSRFLTEVKKGLHPSLSFADELAEMLHISRDSAYRRIRGETIMALEEIRIICSRCRISVDSLLTPASSLVSFHHRSVGMDGFTFYDWLRSLDEQLTIMRQSPGGRIDYLANDIPIFYYFQFPLLSAYKMYFWLRTYLRIEFEDARFSTEIIPREYITLGAKIFDKYASLDSTEIWGEETVISTLRQIEYHFACGLFHSADDALAVIDSYEQMIASVHAAASCGRKGISKGSIQLYKNDLFLVDNTLYLRLGNGRATMLQQSPFEWLSTSHEGYCKETEKRISNAISKSELISISGERERNIYFNQVRAKIGQTRQWIKSAAAASLKNSI